MKKLFTFILSLAISVSNLTVTALAKEEETEENDPIYYVCMGDSVSSGYELSGTDRYVTENTKNNYKNDPELCYGHIVAEAINEVQGYDGDVYDTYSNISSAGGTLEDFTQLIYNEDYYIKNMLYVGLGYTPDDLSYHDIYVNEISKADLITIQCGNNDLIEDMLISMGNDMKNDPNPIVKVIYKFIVQMSLGNTNDFETLLNNLGTTITAGVEDGSITIETVQEALEYLSYSHLSETMLELAANAEVQYPVFIEALRSVNDEADLVAVGFYGSFGNSLYCQESLQNLSEGISEIMKSAVTSMITGGQYDAQSAVLSVLLSAVSYPAVYLTMGKVVNVAVDELNTYLQGFCADEDITYVDIMDIPNEDNLDPHPDEAGHAYIAEQVENAIIEAVSITVEEDEEVSVEGNSQVILGQDSTYTIEGLKDNEEVSVTVNGELTDVVDHSFVINVKEDAEVVVTVSEKPVVKVFPFTDVPENKWYRSYVENVYDLGLMTGTTETTFEPYATLNRGMLATILYRMAGSPEVENTESFEDVAQGKYYTNAIAWCKSTGVVTGYGDGTFKPSQAITRQELATMLMRYVDYCGAKGEVDISLLEDYPDASSVSSWAKEGMAWAVTNKVITGDQNNLNPRGNANRAQCAKMISVTYDLLNK